ncbi:MAG: tryptophan 7-halogenase, partial [Gammaproteobacteria bacterium]
YHPFSLPAGFGELNLAGHWPELAGAQAFADAVCPQPAVCERGLAPKQISTPEYAFNLNYGYHLDAGKFALLLERHCTTVLGVRHVADRVVCVNGDPGSDIRSVGTTAHGEIEGDLFIDCSGLAALLIGKHFGIPFRSRKQQLFNDSALAAQVPYPDPEAPIASHTLGTARSNGWIWDIGLPSRRGVGYVYSSAHTDDSSAEAELRAYLARSGAPDPAGVALRKLSFTPGHRALFWHRNCVAVGMSAGFIEPLEASALALVEQSARIIAEQLPADRSVMDAVARRFNERMLWHWDRIVDFLKLHYVLSRREDTPYWVDCRSRDSLSDQLAEMLLLWETQAPWIQDAPMVDELFPAASFQYVLYGMGAVMRGSGARAAKQRERSRAAGLFRECAGMTAKLLGVLPTNRALLGKITQFGLPSI